MFRRGFFTSPAVNVMLFHASAEKSEPTCTTARITSRFTKTTGPPIPTWTGCIALQPAFFQNSMPPEPKFAAIAVALRPMVRVSRTSAARDSALAEVKTFWIMAPNFTPNMFTKARKKTITIPVRLAVLTPISMLPSTIGPTVTGGTWAICHSQCVVEMVGKKTPRNLPKATQTAAMVPVWMTRKRVQP